ncbi:GntR family transcriptional regulator [Paenarthrobacter ilicis]
MAALRTAITRGELPPGHRLIETELCQSLKVSRGTLREALRQLVQEGLVTAGTRGHLSVRLIKTTDHRDIHAVRAALELLAVQTLCDLPDRDSAVTTLRSAAAAIDAAQEAPYGERLDTEAEFYRTLCNLTGNTTLLRSWVSLEAASRMSTMLGAQDGGAPNETKQHHHDVVAAIDAGEALTPLKATPGCDQRESSHG